jgi:hypothetical protein
LNPELQLDNLSFQRKLILGRYLVVSPESNRHHYALFFKKKKKKKKKREKENGAL